MKKKLIKSTKSTKKKDVMRKICLYLFLYQSSPIEEMSDFKFSIFDPLLYQVTKRNSGQHSCSS